MSTALARRPAVNQWERSASSERRVRENGVGTGSEPDLGRPAASHKTPPGSAHYAIIVPLRRGLTPRQPLVNRGLQGMRSAGSSARLRLGRPFVGHLAHERHAHAGLNEVGRKVDKPASRRAVCSLQLTDHKCLSRQIRSPASFVLRVCAGGKTASSRGDSTSTLDTGGRARTDVGGPCHEHA
jgi:hypothetical protein